MKNNRLIIIISITLIIVLSLTYAYFSGTIENIGGSLSVNSGKVTFTISETRVNVNNLVPIYNTDYEEEAYKHTFTITRDNDSTLDACYELNLVIDNIGTNLRNQYLHYRLEYDNVSTEGTFNGKTNGDSITLITNQSSNSIDTEREYILYIWLEYSDSVDQTSILTGNASSRTLTSHLEISGDTTSCISEEIPLTAYTLNNNETEESYSDLYSALGTQYEASVSCINGSVYTYSNGSITLDTLVVPDRCTINFTTKSYTVYGSTPGNGTVTESSSILYGGETNLTATPSTGYYLSSAECTNNYTTNASTGTTSITSQNVTISNNNNASNSTCAFTYSPRTFTVNFDKVESDASLSTLSKEVTYNSSYGTLPEAIRTGYNFSGWYTSGGVQRETSTTVSITEDETLYAHYNAKTYTVTGDKTGSGSVTSSTVNYGSTTTLTVSPSTGYYLSAGSCDTEGYTITNMTTGDNATGQGSQTVTINNNSTDDGTTCTFTFATRSYTVNGSSNNNTYGIVTSSSAINYGGTTTLTVTPSTGYYLSAGSCNTDGYTITNMTTGDNATGQGSQTVTINNNSTNSGTTCNFTFSPRGYTVTGSAVGSGSVTSSSTVNYGSTTTLTVSPSTGYYLSAGSCNTSGYTITGMSTGTSATGSQNVTINNNSTNGGTTCTFTFTAFTYQVTASVSGGSASPTSRTISYNGSGTFTISANTGYNLSGATVSGTGCSLNAAKTTLTASNVTSTRTCTVTIPKNTNTLIVVPGGGTIAFNGSDRTSSASVTKSYGETIALPNPKTNATYTISYNANSQSASYTGSPTSVTRNFSSYTDSGTCGTLSNEIYTFPSNNNTTCTKTATYNTTSNSFTLPAISRTGYSCKWAEGSANGTEYNGNTSRTITSNTTYFAKCSKNSYTVYGSSNNTSYGTVTASSAVTYGDSTTLTVSPASGYYLSNFSCNTTGYTHNANTGTSYTSAQTVTIYNNSTLSGTTCIATFAQSSYIMTLTKPLAACGGMFCSDFNREVGEWIATYTCSGGVGTITSCGFNDTYRPITITCTDGGTNHRTPTYTCLQPDTPYGTVNPKNDCLSTFTYSAYGYRWPGFDESIAC